MGYRDKGLLAMGKRSMPRRRLAPTIVALLIVSPFSLATDTLPERENPQEIVSPDPSTVEALRRDAEGVVARVLEAYPEDPDAHALMGKLHSLHGHTREARRSWERCLELDPRRADIYDALARMAWDNGEFERAATASRQALRIDPAMSEVALLLGRSLLELGQIEEAIAVMEPAAGRSGSGHFHLAQAYMQSKAYEKARDSYQRAVAEHPDHAQAYYGLAMASSRLGQPEKARQYQEAFRKLIAEDPESVKARKRNPGRLSGLAEARNTAANALTGAADFYRLHGNLQEAERLWHRAAVLDAYHSASREALRALYEDSDRLEDARTFFEQLAQVPSPNVWDHLYLGHVYLRLERYDEAERAYANLTRYAPDRADGYEALVQLYLTRGQKHPAARPLASKAVQLRPSPQNYFLLAHACMRIGDRADALTAIEQALKLDPDNDQYRRLYDQLRKAR